MGEEVWLFASPGLNVGLGFQGNTDKQNPF